MKKKLLSVFTAFALVFSMIPMVPALAEDEPTIPAPTPNPDAVMGFTAIGTQSKYACAAGNVKEEKPIKWSTEKPNGTDLYITVNGVMYSVADRLDGTSPYVTPYNIARIAANTPGWGSFTYPWRDIEFDIPEVPTFERFFMHEGEPGNLFRAVSVQTFVNYNHRAAVEQTEGGTVTVSSEWPKTGSTVTITAVPDEGYIVTGYTVVADDDLEFTGDVEVSEDGTFVMPEGCVMVSAIFEEEAYTHTAGQIDIKVYDFNNTLKQEYTFHATGTDEQGAVRAEDNKFYYAGDEAAFVAAGGEDVLKAFANELAGDDPYYVIFYDGRVTTTETVGVDTFQTYLIPVEIRVKGHFVTLDPNMEHGTATLSTTMAEEDEAVYIYTTPEAGYRVKDITYILDNELSFHKDEPYTRDISPNMYMFRGVDSCLTVHVEFEEIPLMETLHYRIRLYDGNGYEYKVIEEPVVGTDEQGITHQNGKFYFNAKLPGYEEMRDGLIDAKKQEYDWARIGTWGTAGHYEFTEDGVDYRDVRLDLDGKLKAGFHFIELVESTYGEAEVPQYAEAGTVVTIPYKAAGAYELDLENTAVTAVETGAPVEVTDNGNDTISFTMPDACVTVDIAYVISVQVDTCAYVYAREACPSGNRLSGYYIWVEGVGDQGYSDGMTYYFYGDPASDKFIANALPLMKQTAAERLGATVDELTYAGEETTLESADYWIKKKYTLTATIVRSYHEIMVVSGENGSMTINNGTSNGYSSWYFEAGDDVRITLKPDPGYEFDHFETTSYDGNREITVKYSPTTGNFLMPDACFALWPVFVASAIPADYTAVGMQGTLECVGGEVIAAFDLTWAEGATGQGYQRDDLDPAAFYFNGVYAGEDSGADVADAVFELNSQFREWLDEANDYVTVTDDADVSEATVDGIDSYRSVIITKTASIDGHLIRVVKADNGSVTAPQLAKAGDTVTFTANAVEGYHLQELVFATESGEAVTVEVDLEACTFVMPDACVEVTPVFAEDVEPTYYTAVGMEAVAKCAGGDVEESFDLTWAPSAGNEGLHRSDLDPAAFYFLGSYSKDGSDTAVAAAMKALEAEFEDFMGPMIDYCNVTETVTVSDPVIDGDNVFRSVIIKREAVVVGHIIAVADVPNGSARAPYVGDAGSPIVFEATPDEGFELVGLSFADPDGKALEVDYDLEDGTFTMPDSCVIVIPEFAAIHVHEVKLSADLENGTIVVKNPDAKPGETVEYTIVPNAGYQYVADSFKVIELDKPAISFFATAEEPQPVEGTFVMPNSCVELYAAFEVVPAPDPDPDPKPDPVPPTNDATPLPLVAGLGAFAAAGCAAAFLARRRFED